MKSSENSDKVHWSRPGDSSKCERGVEETHASRNGKPAYSAAPDLLQQLVSGWLRLIFHGERNGTVVDIFSPRTCIRLTRGHSIRQVHTKQQVTAKVLLSVEMYEYMSKSDICLIEMKKKLKSGTGDVVASFLCAIQVTIVHHVIDWLEVSWLWELHELDAFVIIFNYLGK